jgi:hypothetical protein
VDVFEFNLTHIVSNPLVFPKSLGSVTCFVSLQIPQTPVCTVKTCPSGILAPRLSAQSKQTQSGSTGNSFFFAMVVCFNEKRQELSHSRLLTFQKTNN